MAPQPQHNFHFPSGGRVGRCDCNVARRIAAHHFVTKCNVQEMQRPRLWLVADKAVIVAMMEVMSDAVVTA